MAYIWEIVMQTPYYMIETAENNSGDVLKLTVRGPRWVDWEGSKFKNKGDAIRSRDYHAPGANVIMIIDDVRWSSQRGTY